VLAHNFQDAKISFQPLYAGQYIYALMVNNGKNSSFEDYLFFEVGQLQTDRSGTESLDYGAYPPSLETIEEGGCNCSVVK